MHRALADAVLYVHFAFVLAVLAGFVVFPLALWRGGRIGRAFWPRTLHLIAIAIVAIEGAAGIACPLSDLEKALRGRDGDRSFVSRWIDSLLFFDVPEWTLAIAYGALAAAAIAMFAIWPPRRR